MKYLAFVILLVSTNAFSGLFDEYDIVYDDSRPGRKVASEVVTANIPASSEFVINGIDLRKTSVQQIINRKDLTDSQKKMMIKFKKNL